MNSFFLINSSKALTSIHLWFLSGLMCITLISLSSTLITAQSSSKPNLVIIQTDEHNFRTLGCYRQQLRPDQAQVWGVGNVVQTPNIDHLAENGVLFTKFYAASPVCTPSRGSFISGLYPQNNGAPHNDLPLHDQTITYSMVLRDAGYKTGFIGKWHLDGTGKPQWEPARKFGFEDNRYMFNRGHWKKFKIGPKGPQVAAKNKNGKPTYDLENADEQSYSTDFLVDRGIDFITENKQHPFSLYISLPDPHGPDRVRSPYDTMYQHMDFKAPPTYNKPQSDIPAWAAQAKNAKLEQATYFGMVKCIDDNVGKIITHLRENDLLENTIIIFTSDHGDLRGEHHRHNKGNPLEASAKVPFIAFHPKKIPSGSVVNKTVNTVDFTPTILTFMGQEVPAPMQGRDFSALLINPVLEKDWEDIAFMRYGGRSKEGRWLAAVTSRYKLVLSEQDTPWLIDMKADPNEMTNFFAAPAYRDIIKKLSIQLREYGKVHQEPYLIESKIEEDLEILCSDKF